MVDAVVISPNKAADGPPFFNDALGYGAEAPNKKRRIPLDLSVITDKNLGQLRKLNLSTFPIKYHEVFYQNVLKHADFSRLGYLQELLVGAVCARLESGEGESKRLYIMTLSVLSAYRKGQMGAQLVEWLLSEARAKKTELKISDVYLHVQSTNKGALAFYSRFDFKEIGRIENYYNGVEPREAIVLSCAL
eukprot:GDKH01002321.1.p1 GENE.GDKH01002321.1~~GDKH01002321.1.p1  ORF type:complete len:191 (+),score=38.86 GDKH01002321.1:69-641(+)